MPSNSKLTKPRSGVFISYARSDGEKFANDLRQRLEKEGVPLWQDRVGMEGGRDWWLQITEALDQVEFMALVITPNALKSETVRKEWRYARQQGVCVYPIKGTSNLDFESLPRWMRDAHFYDLQRELQKFLNDLQTHCQTRRVPFMAEDLPEGFIERPGEFDQLLKLLTSESREEPVAITAALRGAGGYDGRSGAERFTLSGHMGWVNGCAVSADGATIVSASGDQTLKVWDGRSGAERFTLSGHAGWVDGCALSADGATIISASWDQTLKVWDGRTGKCVSTLHVDGPLYSCACSADGEIIAAAGARGIYFLRFVR